MAILKLTNEKIDSYKSSFNLANTYYCKSIKSLYAKIMSFQEYNLDKKLESIKEYELYFDSLPIESQNEIFFKLQKRLDK